jgi:hypothetical protein
LQGGFKAVSLLAQIVYAGMDFVIGFFLLVMATPIGWYDVYAFFLIGIGLMTLLKGTFMISNAYELGGPANGLGIFLLIRALLITVGIVFD